MRRCALRAAVDIPPLLPRMNELKRAPRRKSAQHSGAWRGASAQQEARFSAGAPRNMMIALLIP